MATVSTEAIEKILVSGDLAKLDLDQRVSYYNSVCESIGLNPLTRPFEYITLNGKLTLYARKDATDQLRRIYDVSVEELRPELKSDIGIYVVTAFGRNGQGRKDTSLAAVSVLYPEKIKENGNWKPHPKAGKQFTGDDLANAFMKAETKAKRRLTLSLVGLGMLDETELDTVETVAPEQLLVVKDGQIIVPPQPTPEVVITAAEPKKKGRPKKEESTSAPWANNFPHPDSVQKTDEPKPPSKATSFEFGENVPEGGTNVPETSTANIHGLHISDSDLPENLQSKPAVSVPALEPDTKPTEAEMKQIGEKINSFKGLVKTDLGAWIRKTYGKSSREISKQQWSEVVARLDTAFFEGKLKELLTA